LTVHQTAIQQFNPASKYDLIVSNPPFFENDLHSPIRERNSAMHDTSLTLEELANVVKQHLSPDGTFAILLPYHRINYFVEIMNKADFLLGVKVLVKQSITHDYFRGILSFSQQKKDSTGQEIIIIKEKDNCYSQRFADLLKDYYLH
jgi:tRNA1Val (adenine37-N6)-methyltransferase